jgi:hypothetical protein
MARIWRRVAIVLLVALCGTGLNSARWPIARRLFRIFAWLVWLAFVRGERAPAETSA